MANIFKPYQGGIQPLQGQIETGARIGQMFQQGLSSTGQALAEGLQAYNKNAALNEQSLASIQMSGAKMKAMLEQFGDLPEYAPFASQYTDLINKTAKAPTMSLTQRLALANELESSQKTFANDLQMYEFGKQKRIEAMAYEGVREGVTSGETVIGGVNINMPVQFDVAKSVPAQIDEMRNVYKERTKGLPNVPLFDVWLVQNADKIKSQIQAQKAHEGLKTATIAELDGYIGARKQTASAVLDTISKASVMQQGQGLYDYAQGLAKAAESSFDQIRTTMDAEAQRQSPYEIAKPKDENPEAISEWESAKKTLAESSVPIEEQQKILGVADDAALKLEGVAKEHRTLIREKLPKFNEKLNEAVEEMRKAGMSDEEINRRTQREWNNYWADGVNLRQMKIPKKRGGGEFTKEETERFYKEWDDYAKDSSKIPSGDAQAFNNAAQELYRADAEQKAIERGDVDVMDVIKTYSPLWGPTLAFVAMYNVVAIDNIRKKAWEAIKTGPEAWKKFKETNLEKAIFEAARDVDKRITKGNFSTLINKNDVLKSRVNQEVDRRLAELGKTRTTIEPAKLAKIEETVTAQVKKSGEITGKFLKEYTMAERLANNGRLIRSGLLNYGPQIAGTAGMLYGGYSAIEGALNKDESELGGGLMVGGLSAGLTGAALAARGNKTAGAVIGATGAITAGTGAYMKTRTPETVRAKIRELDQYLGKGSYNTKIEELAKNRDALEKTVKTATSTTFNLVNARRGMSGLAPVVPQQKAFAMPEKAPFGMKLGGPDVFVGREAVMGEMPDMVKRDRLKEYVSKRLGYGGSSVDAVMSNMFKSNEPVIREITTPSGAKVVVMAGPDGKWSQLSVGADGTKGFGTFGTQTASGAWIPKTYKVGTQGRTISIAGEFAGPTKESYIEFQKGLADYMGGVSAAEELKDIIGITGKSMPWNADIQAKAAGLVARIKAAVRVSTLGTGAISDYEQKLLDDVIQDPTKFFTLDSANRARIQGIFDKLDNHLINQGRVWGLDVKIGTGGNQNAQAESNLRRTHGIRQ